MAVAHSWPLAGDPAQLSRVDNDDWAQNTWTLSWEAHMLPRNPLRLFHGPIFHPERNTIAYSEHMFVQSVMGAPLFWMGLSPILVHSLLTIAGFALSGWAMYLLIARWTGQPWAGLLSGLVYAFNAHSLTRFAHLQALHVEFFPLLLYAVDRLIVERTRAMAILTGAAFVLQALCSNYYLVFSAFTLLIAALVRAREWWPHREMRHHWLGVIAIAAAGVVPFLWPYYEVHREHGLERSIEEVANYSAGWRDYLATGGRLHYDWWSHRLFEGRTALFPGLTALALAIAGAWTHWRDVRVRTLLACGAVGILMSFGPALPGYALLHEYVPLIAGLRNAARWGWLTLASIAVLAGFGAHGAMGAKGAKGLVLAAMVLVTVEAWRAPVGFTRFERLPRIYDRIAAERDVVLAEFPLYSGDRVSENGQYVLANTRYLRPLVNGYSGFQPPTYEERAKVLTRFPDPSAIAALRALDVTHVTVHRDAFRDRYGDAVLRSLDEAGALQLVEEIDGIRLYRLK
ncbi:MAG TPA: hypothetical protein VJ691_16875 [Vicinamibacterales bacterium]|nr:hypothetical protein [Vicinamibacterales bacterium]